MDNEFVLLAIGIAGLLYTVLLQVAKKSNDDKKYRELQAINIPGFTIHGFVNTDLVNKRFIGLERSKKVLVLADLEKPGEGVVFLSLQDIASCRLEQHTTEMVHRGRNRVPFEKLLTKVSLQLFSADRNLLSEFVFFDPEKNTLKEMAPLLQKAHRWKKLMKRNGITEIA